MKSVQKLVLLCFCFLANTNLNAQSPELIAFVKQDLCDCMTTLSNPEMKSLETCFTRIMLGNAREFKELIDESSNVSEYDQGIAIGQKIFVEIQNELILTCNAFYKFIENMRGRIFESMKVELSKEELKSLNKSIKADKTAKKLYIRAMHYYQSGKYKKALNDINEVRSLDDRIFQAHLVIGMIKESQKSYEEAISHYQVFKDKTGMDEMAAFISIAKRKLALSKK